MLAIEALPRPREAELAIGSVLGSDGRTAIPDPPELDTLTALAGLPCLARRPTGTTFSQWIADTLVRCRGVLAALPREVWPATANEYDSTAGRIFAIDPTRASGRSWWWLWRLKASEYTQHTAYAPDDATRVYHTDGLESKANSWLPAADDIDALVLSAFFDRVTLAGFAVTVRHVPSPLGSAPGTLDRLPALHQRILLELEAAAMGSSPAILAMMLVHGNDKYALFEGTAAAADHDTSDTPRLSGDPGRVVACVTVTQTHSFRLADLLKAYNKVLGDPVKRPTLPGIDGSVYELTMAIARRVRALANSRILKLNMTPDTVVFCPLLYEDADGKMQAHGYGYDGMQAVRGVPYLWDFDPLYTKRVGSQSTDYDADCAYVVMMLVLLASVRAQYGETVSRVMIHRMIGRSIDGAAVPPGELPGDFEHYDLMAAGLRTREKASQFCTVLRSVMPAFTSEHKATLGTAYADVARDFAEMVRSEVFAHWASEAPDTPVFAALVRYLSGSAVADTFLFNAPSSAGDAVLERERAHRVEQRLDAVRAARMARMRGRLE
jgi:hypothetical protein